MPQLQWNSTNNPSPFGPDIGGAQIPVEPLTIDPGPLTDFVGIPDTVVSSISKVQANVSRLFDANSTVLDQHDTPAWYNFPARISNAVSGVNDALQSTMIKVIILVAILGTIAIFGLSYIQAKGAKLA